MPILLNTAISALDTPSSLLPFFVKDAFDITGRTAMAQHEGGKHEAREKFIEEAGTSLFWIGGIPAGRWIANKIFKNKVDTDIHFKRINSEGIQSYYADKLEQTVDKNGKKITKSKFSKEDLAGIELGGGKLNSIKAKLTDAGYIANKTKGFYKKFHIGVTAATVLANLVILSVAIPKLNQLLSRKIISKETKGRERSENRFDITAFKANNKYGIDNFIDKSNKKQNQKTNHGKTPSFGSLKDLVKFKELFDFSTMAETVQLEPVSGMLLLDYGISGSRVTITPRDNNERIENAVKEGGIIFFFYYAADLIKKGLANVANKCFKTPIGLDYKVVNCPEFLAKLKKHQDKDEVLNFVKIRDKDAETKKLSSKVAKIALADEIDKVNEVNVIKMIDKELMGTTKSARKENAFKNFTLQMAQKEGLIDIEYDDALGKWIRHSKKYIETGKLINLNENLKNFYDEAFKKINNVGSKATVESVISKTKKVKMASIFANMAICCASLSFIVPKIQYIIREHRTQTKSAPGIKLYQELAQNDQLKV